MPGVLQFYLPLTDHHAFSVSLAVINNIHGHFLSQCGQFYYILQECYIAFEEHLYIFSTQDLSNTDISTKKVKTDTP